METNTGTTGKATAKAKRPDLQSSSHLRRENPARSFQSGLSLHADALT